MLTLDRRLESFGEELSLHLRAHIFQQMSCVKFFVEVWDTSGVLADYHEIWMKRGRTAFACFLYEDQCRKVPALISLPLCVKCQPFCNSDASDTMFIIKAAYHVLHCVCVVCVLPACRMYCLVWL